MANNHYDVIIIGTGAGGGTLAHRLAPSGKKILFLERGTFLPGEKANWDSKEINQNRRYRTSLIAALMMLTIFTFLMVVFSLRALL